MPTHAAQAFVQVKADVEHHYGHPFLVVTVDIVCAVCGHQRVRLAGAHLPALVNMLLEMIELYPALTRDDDREIRPH